MKTLLRFISFCLILASMLLLFCKLDEINQTISTPLENTIEYTEIRLTKANYDDYISVNTYVEEVFIGSISETHTPVEYILHVTTDKKQNVYFKNVTITWEFPSRSATIGSPVSNLSYDGESHISAYNTNIAIKMDVTVERITGTVLVPADTNNKTSGTKTGVQRILEKYGK